MVLCAKSKLQDAESVKTYLQNNQLFLEGYQYDKDNEFVYFPVTEKFSTDLPIIFEERLQL